MRDIISIRELLSIPVRRGKLILCFTMIFAVLMGGIQASKQISAMNSPENSDEKIEERYQTAIENYKKQQENLQEQLVAAERKLASQQKYNDNSLKMELDPYDFAITTINFSITDMDGATFQQVFQLEGTPVDYVISRIQTHYRIYWNNLDLEEIMEGTSYAGTADQYLREMVSLSVMDGGGLTLNALGDTKERSQELASTVYAYLQAAQPAIGESAYPHRFTLVSNITKLSVDDSLDSTQRSNQEQLEANQSKVDGLKKSLDDLKEPERESGYSMTSVIKAVAKWTIFGAFMGIFFALVYTFLAYALQGQTESVHRVESALSLVFLGSAAAPKKFWDRFASWIAGEKSWQDDSERLSYLKERLKSYVPKGSKVAVISTLPVNAETTGIQIILESISAQSHTVRFINRAGQNPEILEAVQDCDGIILAEQIGVSRWEMLAENKLLAEQMKTPIYGFVTL